MDGGEAQVQVSLPYALREFTGGAEAIHLEARDLGDAIAKLNARYPGLGYRILDDQGRLRRYVHAFLNDEPVSEEDLEAVRLQDGDVVYILPSVAGG